MKMTEEKVKAMVRAGLGQGMGAQYKPWLQVRRGRSSKVSNQVCRYLPTLGRDGHFMSGGEADLAMLLLWIGVEDLWEQKPMWPTSHLHPLGEVDPIGRGKVRGLLAIAEEAGIEHGNEPGTAVPYVASIDFLVIVRGEDSRAKAILISMKGDDVLKDCDHGKIVRPAERLELERRYALEIGARYVLVSAGIVSNRLAGNLKNCMARASIGDDHESHTMACALSSQLARSNRAVWADVHHFAADHSITCPEAYDLFWYSLWRRLLQVDISEPIVTGHPLALDGGKFHKHVADLLLGT